MTAGAPDVRIRDGALGGWAVAAVIILAAALFYALFKWPRPSRRHRVRSNFSASVFTAPDEAFDAAFPDILRQTVPEAVSQIAGQAGGTPADGDETP